MKPTNGRTSAPQPPSDGDGGTRPAIKWAVIAVLVLCAGIIAWQTWKPAAKPTTPDEPPPTEAANPAGKTETVAAAPKPTGPTSPGATVVQPALVAPPSTTSAVPVDPTTGALVASLKSLAGTNAALTADAVAAWRTNFAQLVQAGSSAVPAIKAFLDQKTDAAFSTEAWQALGYRSTRLAALEALRQIGGPDAIAAMDSVLSTTQSPREIAVLARNLEEASPGQYRVQALTAASAGLAAAAAARNPELDVAPLFEVFQHYGDASAIPELEKAMGQWKYYSTIALANLAEGAGVPTLLKLADPSTGSGNRVVALEMVAQLATDNPAARQFLIDQVANKTIPSNLWPYLTGPLSGDQYFPVDSAITQYPALQTWSDLKTTHISYGNQNLYNLPGNQNLTAEGIGQRLALVDELLKTTTEPSAVQTLQRARDALTARYGRSAAQPATGTATGTGQ